VSPEVPAVQLSSLSVNTAITASIGHIVAKLPDWRVQDQEF
jgi:hypothetical protein